MSHANGGWMNSDQRDATRWAALFPIMGDKVSSKCRGYMPMTVMREHEPQALSNHAQSIDRLKARGGLSPAEAMAVVSDQRFYDLWYKDGEVPDEDAIWDHLQAMAKERFPDFDPITGDCNAAPKGE